MGFVNATIVNCKKASIRRTPWIPWRDREIVGVRDGSETDVGEIKKGDTIQVSPNDICYDWIGRKFYKVRLPKGWIYEGVIQMEGDGDG